jgi:hypothetical protein
MRRREEGKQRNRAESRIEKRTRIEIDEEEEESRITRK